MENTPLIAEGILWVLFIAAVIAIRNKLHELKHHAGDKIRQT